MSTEETYYAVKGDAPDDVVYCDLSYDTPHGMGYVWYFGADYYHDVNTYVRYKCNDLLFVFPSNLSIHITMPLVDKVMATIRAYHADDTWLKEWYCPYTWDNMPKTHDMWIDSEFDDFELFLRTCAENKYKIVRKII